MSDVLERRRNRPMMGMDGGMDRGGMRGGGMGRGGMRGGACYVYDENQRSNNTLVTPDLVYDRGIDMNIPLTMDDGNTITMWGFTDGGGMGTRRRRCAPPRVGSCTPTWR